MEAPDWCILPNCRMSCTDGSFRPLWSCPSGSLYSYLCLNEYAGAKEAFDGASAEDKQEVIDGINSVQEGLGDAFASGKDDFECNALDLMNHEAFFKKL